jgi:hypothetical protein
MLTGYGEFLGAREAVSLHATAAIAVKDSTGL